MAPEPPRNRPPVGTAHVRLTGTLQSSSCGVGFWTPCAEDTSADDLNTIATDIYNAWADNILADQSSSASLEECEVLLYRTADELAGYHTEHRTGATGGEALPANCCAVASWSTPSTWRGGHPRTYIWGIPLTAMDSTYQTLVGTYRTALESLVVLFAAAFNAVSLGGGLSLSSMRFYNAGAALAPPYLISITPRGVDSTIGSQRRRLKS